MWILALAALARAQLHVAHDEASVVAIHSDNRFFARTAFNQSEQEDRFADASTACGGIGSIQLAWTAQLGSSVYSTPVIVVSAAGTRAVVAATFVRYTEAVRGTDGHPAAGWPYAFGHATFHASPLLYDADADGIDEVRARRRPPPRPRPELTACDSRARGRRSSSSRSTRS
jgi:hypothetical protein